MPGYKYFEDYTIGQKQTTSGRTMTEAVSREEVFFDEYHQRYASDLIEYAIKLRDSIPSYWE